MIEYEAYWLTDFAVRQASRKNYGIIQKANKQVEGKTCNSTVNRGHS